MSRNIVLLPRPGSKLLTQAIYHISSETGLHAAQGGKSQEEMLDSHGNNKRYTKYLNVYPELLNFPLQGFETSISLTKPWSCLAWPVTVNSFPFGFLAPVALF